MRFAKSKVPLLLALAVFTTTIQAEAAKKSATKSQIVNSDETQTIENSEVDLAALADILNSYSTLAELTNDLVHYGLATSEEKTALVHFMQDRGIQPDSPLERVKYDKSSSTLKWRELSLTVQSDGTLKNSFGQILKTSGKTLDTVFGEAYLSFDRRTARARAMDLFLQEAQADSTGATPVARAWGALTAGIYGGLRTAATTGKAALGGLAVASGWSLERFWTFYRNSMYKNTVYCGPKGEFILRPGSEYFNLGEAFHKQRVKADQASEAATSGSASGSTSARKESWFGKDFDTDAASSLATGGDALREAVRSMKATLVIPPNKNGEMVVAPELLQKFFAPKAVPKCDQPRAAQMQVIVRASGRTAEEKIRNAEIGKGYGPGADRNWDQDVAAESAKKAAPAIRRVKASQ